MKTTKEHIIVHIFAILHALTALGCRLAGFSDEYLLTLLTITMLVIICAQSRMRISITVCVIMFGNLAAYLLGIAIAQLIGLTGLQQPLASVISTIITTEILGIFLIVLSRYFEKGDSEVPGRQLVWLFPSCAVAYAVRVVLAVCRERQFFNQFNNENVYYFLLSFCAMTVLVAVTMIGFEIAEKKRFHKEIKKRHQAQYRYMKLNQQVNPHFLFNSLNVLDCLVVDGQNEKASTYIHKLSSLYRYMLRNDDEMLVKLKDEMYFVSQYVDLLQVRFLEGFEVRTDIPEDLMNRNVVPCSVQLLIENAVKHNAISREKPLVVKVFSPDGHHIRVSNNICPKLTAVNSTGTGLKYLRQQYNDISGEDITVTDTEEEFTVDLPTI